MSEASVKHVSITEAMKISGYSRLHLYNLVRARKLAMRKSWGESGPLFMIELVSLERYLKKHPRIKRSKKPHADQAEAITIELGGSADANS